MLRPSHFVLLFVIFVCAHAARAIQGPVIPSDLIPVDEPIESPVGDIVPDNSDLDTDATHWGYYRPRWNYGWGRGWGHGWGRGWGGGRWGGHSKSHYWY